MTPVISNGFYLFQRGTESTAAIWFGKSTNYAAFKAAFETKHSGDTRLNGTIVYCTDTGDAYIFQDTAFSALA